MSMLRMTSRSTAIFIAKRNGATIASHARPCAASSSFDGELAAIHDALYFVDSAVSSKVLIADNIAALQMSTRTLASRLLKSNFVIITVR